MNIKSTNHYKIVFKPTMELTFVKKTTIIALEWISKMETTIQGGRVMVKIRLIMADTDERYINRLSDYIAFHYANQFEISIFTDPEILEEYVQTNSAHCIVATRDFLKLHEGINSKAAFLLLHDGSELDEDYNVRTIAKYQNVENIIKEIKTASADKIGFVPSQEADGNMKLYLAEKIAGGTGTTTVAIAFARYLAKKGKRVLYLNMELYGSIKNVLSGGAARDFSDVIYLLKSQKGNMELKIEGIVQADVYGVNYIEPCKMPADLLSLTKADMELLLDTFAKSGKYDYLIIDREFGLSDMDYFLRRRAYRMLYVSSGLAVQNDKFDKAMAALRLYEQKNDVALKEKMLLIYNKYSNRRSHKWEDGMQEVLGFPKLDAADDNEIVEELSAKEGFQTLM